MINLHHGSELCGILFNAEVMHRGFGFTCFSPEYLKLAVMALASLGTLEPFWVYVIGPRDSYAPSPRYPRSGRYGVGAVKIDSAVVESPPVLS